MVDLLLRSGARATGEYSGDIKNQVVAFLEVSEQKNYRKKEVWEEIKESVLSRASKFGMR